MMLEEARKDAEQAKIEIIAEAKAGGQAGIRAQQARLQRATDQALKELSERATNLAVDLAGKIVRPAEPAATMRGWSRKRWRICGKRAGELTFESHELQSLSSLSELAIPIEAEHNPIYDRPQMIESWREYEYGRRQTTCSNVGVGRAGGDGLCQRARRMPREAAGQTEAVMDELDSFIGDVLDAKPKFEAVLGFGAHLAGRKERVARQSASRSQASPLFLNFLKVVARHGRLDILAAHPSRRRTISTTRCAASCGCKSPSAADWRSHAGTS